MKRTFIALAALLAIVATSCIPTNDTSYEYEGTFLYKPITFLTDTTWVNPDYLADDSYGAKYFTDTTLARYFLNLSPSLMFYEDYTVSGNDIYDVDSQLFYLVQAEVLNVLPAVQAIDYESVLSGVDSVFKGEITICYEATNTETSTVVMRDTITVITIGE